MEWVEINEFIQGGIGYVTIGLLAFKIFVLDKLGNKNVKKLMSFTALADKNVKVSKTDNESFKKELIKVVIEEIVKPMQLHINDLKNDNAKVVDIAVTTLAMVNVPLDTKKEFFKVITNVNNVSTSAVKVLELSIKNDESKLIVSQDSDDVLNKEINGI